MNIKRVLTKILFSDSTEWCFLILSVHVCGSLITCIHKCLPPLCTVHPPYLLVLNVNLSLYCKYCVVLIITKYSKLALYKNIHIIY